MMTIIIIVVTVVVIKELLLCLSLGVRVGSSLI